MILHAGCAARFNGRCWAGVLFTGPSGAGKSDLVLRLLERGWALVADDRTEVWVSAGALYARPAQTLMGLIEARGLDVVRANGRGFARVALLAECTGDEVERIPSRKRRRILEVEVEAVTLRPLEGSAPAKLERALARSLHGGEGGAGF